MHLDGTGLELYSRNPPSDAEKYIYIDRQLPYLVMIMAIGFSAGTASQIWFEIHTGWWPFALFTFTGIKCSLRPVSAAILHRTRIRHCSPRGARRHLAPPQIS